jgi:hypothetical protein
MATLPAAPAPVTLDALLTRARAVAAVPAPRKPRAHVTSATPRTAVLDDNNEPLLSTVPTADTGAERPLALVLPVSVMTCACGTVHRVPAGYTLAKYAANAHSFRFSRAELSDADRALPRETREHALSISFCEECF